jgi:hypothetical protein
MTDGGERVADPRIERALIAPGHDGAAELVVRLQFASGARDSVTLDAAAAQRLLDHCGVESLDELAGRDWHHLMHVLG